MEVASGGRSLHRWIMGRAHGYEGIDVEEVFLVKGLCVFEGATGHPMDSVEEINSDGFPFTKIKVRLKGIPEYIRKILIQLEFWLEIEKISTNHKTGF